MKRCSSCKMKIGISMFGKDKHAPDGLKYICKRCEMERRRSRTRICSGDDCTIEIPGTRIYCPSCDSRRQQLAASRRDVDASWTARHPLGLKRCPGCKKNLPREAYTRSKHRYDGAMPECKDCMKVRATHAKRHGPEDWLVRHPSGVKLCKGCDRRLPQSSFSRNTRAVDGAEYQCKECNAKRDRILKDKNLARELVTVPHTKRCYSCKETLPSLAFPFNKAKHSGLSPTCRTCTNRAQSLRRYGCYKEYWLAHGIDPDRCAYCESKADTVDHVEATTTGGTDSFDNLLPACFPCNRAKYKSPVAGWRPDWVDPRTSAKNSWKARIQRSVAAKFLRVPPKSVGARRIGYYVGPLLVDVRES